MTHTISLIASFPDQRPPLALTSWVEASSEGEATELAVGQWKELSAFRGATLVGVAV